MTDARHEILARITAANIGAQAPRVVRAYRRGDVSRVGSPAVIDRFVERVTDYRATVVRCDGSLGSVATVVGGELVARGLGTCVVAPGLAQMVPSLPGSFVDDGSLDWHALDAVPAVVTSSVAAIAETGTIVLDGSPRCGRRALTLIPDVHVCLVDTSTVHDSVPQALSMLDPSRPLTFVSGPSATSDIELHRVEGVHGPRTLVVVLVEPTGVSA